MSSARTLPKVNANGRRPGDAEFALLALDCGYPARALETRVASRLADEHGAALVTALGILTVMTVSLMTVISMTSAGSRQAARSGAGQQAYALAEAGINNAVSVLAGNYPGSVVYPGDPNLLPPRTSAYDTGTATWSGSLVPVTDGPWKWQWNLASVGTVTNPTGPGGAAVSRRLVAVVPVTSRRSPRRPQSAC